MIVATAGHVDHGKTSLVRALTGEDTDRLPEEKRRGMSIDLGFAYLPQAGGEPIAFVDVPGHERFIRNMAAGVQGIDLALLVVAADDGPMPQTLEHLQILELLGVPKLLAVLSKTDRVSAERARKAEAEVRALLAPSRFGAVELFPMSLTQNAGLEPLRARLAAEAQALAPRATGERLRMNVDRAFVIDGLGLVATGTVLAGTVAAGDDVRVLPGGRTARVRSLRANHGEAERARAGQRCALALHGVARGEVERGDVIADRAPVPRSKHLDVALHLLPGRESVLKRRCALSVHLGTAVLPAECAPLGAAGAFARLRFARELCAWQGERLLLRDPGTKRLLGAATVADPQPPERAAARAPRLAQLAGIAGRPAGEALDALLAGEPGLVDLDWFASAWHLSAQELERLLAARALASFSVRRARHAMPQARWQALCAALEGALAAWHAAEPAAIGARPAQLKDALAGHALDALPAAIDALVEGGRIARDGPHLRLASHRPILSAEDEVLWQKTAALLEGEEGRPPRVHELSAALALEPKAVAEFLARAARAGRACRVAPNRFFLPGTVGRLVDLAVRLDEESAGRGFRAAAFRDRSGLGRNLTIQVLEFLDDAGYTRRAGEVRRARKLSLEEKRPRWGARTSNPERGV